MFMKENQGFQVNKFSAFLRLGRCKCLASLKSLLWYAPRPRSRFMSSKSTLGGGYGGQGLDGRRLSPPWVPPGLTIRVCRVTAWWLQHPLFYCYGSHILISYSSTYAQENTKADWDEVVWRRLCIWQVAKWSDPRTILSWAQVPCSKAAAFALPLKCLLLKYLEPNIGTLELCADFH